MSFFSDRVIQGQCPVGTPTTKLRGAKPGSMPQRQLFQFGVVTSSQLRPREKGPARSAPSPNFRTYKEPCRPILSASKCQILKRPDPKSSRRGVEESAC